MDQQQTSHENFAGLRRLLEEMKELLAPTKVLLRDYNKVYHEYSLEHGILDVIEQVGNYLPIRGRRSRLLDSNERFMYALAHDLEAPLINMQSLKQLETRLKDDAMRQDLQENFDYSLHKLCFKVETLWFSMSWLSKPNQPEKLNLSTVLAKALNTFPEGIAAPSINMAGDNQTTEITYDPFHLHWLFESLIKNSMYSYSSDSEKELKISVAMFQKGNKHMIQYRDNRLYDPEEANKLNQLFKPGSDCIDGTYHGLYILRELLASQYGTIEMEPTTTGINYNISLMNQAE